MAEFQTEDASMLKERFGTLRIFSNDEIRFPVALCARRFWKWQHGREPTKKAVDESGYLVLWSEFNRKPMQFLQDHMSRGRI